MRMSIKASALVIGMAATVGMVLPMAAPAGAALKPSVSCKTETSPSLKAGGGNVKSTIGGCTPTALKAGGTSTTKAKAGDSSGKKTSTTVWKNGKGTTTATITYAGTPAGKGKCKAPYDLRVKITGKVTKATGAAKAITKVGEPVTASICAISNVKNPKVGQTTIEPGTLFKL